MAKKQVPAPVANRRVPVVVETDEQIGDEAFASGRKRPVLAKNEKGQQVVCSRHTARKHGWEILGKLFTRQRSRQQAAKLVEAAVKEVQHVAETVQKLAQAVEQQPKKGRKG